MKNQQQATMDLEESKMNKKIIVASLSEIANELDNNGHYKEANTVTKVMSRIAQEMPEGELPEDAEAQQEGGFFDTGRKLTQRIFGKPKYPGTPQQQANFERDYPGKWGSFKVAPLTPAQKALMAEVPGEHLGIRFLDPKKYGEEVAFWKTITSVYFNIPNKINEKGWSDIVKTFLDDSKLRYYLSRPDGKYAKHESQPGGTNPKNAVKALITSIQLPSSDDPKVVADWIQTRLPATRGIFRIGTSDGGEISYEQDLSKFTKLRLDERSIIGRMHQMIMNEYGPYGSTDSSGKHTPKETERFSRKLEVLKPIAKELINDPDVIAVKDRLEQILFSAKLKAEKNPLSKLPFRLPKL
jgi:hypothetical protein